MAHEQRGHSPDEIVETFPDITLADVYASLAYYFDNRGEIQDELESDDALAESLRGLFPSRLQEYHRG
ncbi:MAG: DUF433 domain-containing protein [Planctomycetales bacterium]